MRLSCDVVNVCTKLDVYMQYGDNILQNKLFIKRFWFSVTNHKNIIAFRVSRRPREMYCGHAHLCLSVRGRMPTLLH